MRPARAPAAFVPHGGGPWPVLPLPPMPATETAALAGYLGSVSTLPAAPPSFLVVISAHWETPRVTVHAGASPPLLHDYGGMPPAAYALEWPARGAPGRAEQAVALLRDAGFAVDVERARGFDHGVFVPMLLAYPRADVPVVQVSLKRGLDPAEHLAIGRALAPLRDEGGFVIGSGNSFHDLPSFFRPTARARAASAAFHGWLNAAVAGPSAERDRLLVDWARAPAARECHPREEHLLPLLVVAGAAGADAGHVTWRGTANGLELAGHHFG
jgi:aromatic ring-opening dioxygenase catalytic subunit (LigB family)